MGETVDKATRNLFPFDPLIQTESIAFDPQELLTCGNCARQSPPNRLKCIYCGNALSVPGGLTASVKPPLLRKLEIWERGLNLILSEPGAATDTIKIASLLSMEPEIVNFILTAGAALPLARTENEKEAMILQTALEQMGVASTLVNDDALTPETPQIRLNRLDFVDDTLGFTDFNTGQVTLVPSGDIALIVTGIISKTKTDSVAKKGRGGKLLDESATASDEPVLDIYTRADRLGFRIHTTGFDFSCLGDQKSLLARENWGRLVNLLVNISPNAKLVDNYHSIRVILGHVWEIETRTDSLGMRPAGFGRHGFASITSTSNLSQFTKYSRLQWHLL